MSVEELGLRRRALAKMDEAHEAITACGITVENRGFADLVYELVRKPVEIQVECTVCKTKYPVLHAVASDSTPVAGLCRQCDSSIGSPRRASAEGQP